MLNPSGRARLSSKSALGPDIIYESLMYDFDRNRAVNQKVSCSIDGPHAAAAEVSVQSILAFEGSAE
jgi:hypothetical protein